MNNSVSTFFSADIPIYIKIPLCIFCVIVMTDLLIIAYIAGGESID